MSAATVLAPRESVRRVEGVWLRAVQGDAKSITRVPFLVFMSALLGAGMVGVLLLNTTLQNQAFTIRALQKQATDLGYQQAMLQAQIDRANSPQELGIRAAALGMAPNPHAAYLRLEDGRLSGSAVAVTGREIPAITANARAQAEASAAAVAEATPAPAAGALAAQLTPSVAPSPGPAR